MVDRIAATRTSISPLSVKVANGQIFQCNEEIKDLKWWIQGHTFSTDAKIIPLGAYDFILGMDWLEQHNPMTCDLQKKWLQFEYQGQMVKLQGVIPKKKNQLLEISGE